MSIETHKRKKLFMGLEKGYGSTPEYVKIEVLWMRLQEEFAELKPVMALFINQMNNPTLTYNYENDLKVKDELADVSNLVDFLFESMMIETLNIPYESIYGDNI